MRPSTPLTVLATAVGLASTTSAAACSWHSVGGLRKYYIGADPVSGIPSVCHRLWQALGRFAGCGGISGSACGVGHSSTHLHAEFTVGTTCTAGMVHSSWWEATENEFGGIACVPR